METSVKATLIIRALFEFQPLQFDEETYPELYRKTKDYIKGSNVDIADPYRIGEQFIKGI